MRKTYKTPAMKIVAMHTSHLFAASKESFTTGRHLDSRQANFFDDNENEEPDATPDGWLQ